MDKTLIKLKAEVKKLVQDVVDKTELRPESIIINYVNPTKVVSIEIIIAVV